MHENRLDRRLVVTIECIVLKWKIFKKSYILANRLGTAYPKCDVAGK